MRILGIDPGLQTTGFGVVDADGHALRYVASGTISTWHLGTGNLPARLKVLFDGIAEITARYQPDAVGGRNHLRQRQPAVDAAAGTGTAAPAGPRW